MQCHEDLPPPAVEEAIVDARVNMAARVAEWP